MTSRSSLGATLNADSSDHLDEISERSRQFLMSVGHTSRSFNAMITVVQHQKLRKFRHQYQRPTHMLAPRHSGMLRRDGTVQHAQRPRKRSVASVRRELAHSHRERVNWRQEVLESVAGTAQSTASLSSIRSWLPSPERLSDTEFFHTVQSSECWSPHREGPRVVTINETTSPQAYLRPSTWTSH